MRKELPLVNHGKAKLSDPINYALVLLLIYKLPPINIITMPSFKTTRLLIVNIPRNKYSRNNTHFALNNTQSINPSII